MANKAYLLLGTNLGDRAKHLEAARTGLSRTAGTVTELSSVYETAAWGITEQPVFWNQVVVLDTDLPPEALLAAVLAIEQSLGRERDQRWGARTLDVDILYYNDQVIQSPSLSVPHPEIANRRFTLAPLAEIAPDLPHPVLRLTQRRLLDACPDPLPVRRMEGRPETGGRETGGGVPV
jgi:2-amino-4-hydroxy-6-hydroxymethyldihydropteridine diphosphokinase